MAVLVDESKIALANQLKDEGNKLLVLFKYSAAADKYSEAIDLNPSDPIYYANRAQALIKLESFGSAIQDADAAIKLNSGYIKAYYRRASANFNLGKTKLAKRDFERVIKIAPNDKDALKKLKACEDTIRKENFLKAIDSDDRDDPSGGIDISQFVVEPTYNGPRLEDVQSGEQPNVTIEFAMKCVEHFKEEKKIHKKYVLQILSMAKEHFKETSSLLNLRLPEDPVSKRLLHFTVCGDTHGQFYDLCNIFENIGGFPSDTNPYLFNGDFVDRGSFSFETVMTLLIFKLACPTALYMTRGNHETKNMNKIYGFEGEVLHKYDKIVMDYFTGVFNNLPLAAVIQDKVFVVHGGLSTKGDSPMTLDEVRSLQRNKEPPEDGLMSDLLWSDPQPLTGRFPSKRGVGFSFGPDYTKSFLEKNNLNYLVRSHEVKQEGYVEEHDGKCITIFSAPNYCDTMGNKGAFIRFYEDMVPKYTQFDAVQHPNVPPMKYASPLLG